MARTWEGNPSGEWFTVSPKPTKRVPAPPIVISRLLPLAVRVVNESFSLPSLGTQTIRIFVTNRNNCLPAIRRLVGCDYSAATERVTSRDWGTWSGVGRGVGRGEIGVSGRAVKRQRERHRSG